MVLYLQTTSHTMFELFRVRLIWQINDVFQEGRALFDGPGAMVAGITSNIGWVFMTCLHHRWKE